MIKKFYLIFLFIMPVCADIALDLVDEDDFFKLVITNDTPFTKAYLHFIDKNNTELDRKEIVNLENSTKMDYYLPKNLYTDKDNDLYPSITQMTIEINDKQASIDIPKTTTFDTTKRFWSNENIFHNSKYILITEKYNYDGTYKEKRFEYLTYMGSFRIRGAKNYTLLLPYEANLVLKVYNFNTNEWEIVKDYLIVDNYAYFIKNNKFLLFKAYKYPLNSVLIHKGWNLIGQSCRIDVTKFDKFDFNIIWQFEENKWGFYTKNGSVDLKEYEKIDYLSANHGFWIYSNKDYLFDMNSSGECEKNLNLKKGWNLLSNSIATNFNEFGNSKIIWTYFDNKWHVFSKDKKNLDFLKNNNMYYVNTIKPFQGFWVNNQSEESIEPTIVYQNDFEINQGVNEYVLRNGENALKANHYFVQYIGKNNLNGITIMFWVKFSKLEEKELLGIFDGGNYLKLFLTNSTSTTTNHDGTTETYGNWNINAECISNTGLSQRSGFLVNDLKNTKIDKNQWYFVALTIDADGNYRLYYNDKIVGQNSSKVTIPEEYGGYEEYWDVNKIKNITFFINKFDGFIDDIRVYNKVLDDRKIQKIYLNERN